MILKNTLLTYIIITITIIMTIVFAGTMGAINIEFNEVIKIMLSGHNDQLNSTVIWQMRMPRILGALLVGAILGAAGATMQSIFRNPLADPSIIGVSNGSALAIVLAIVWLPTYWVNMYTMPFFAFIGGLITTILVYKIGTVGGKTNSLFLILGGVAISILSATIMGFSAYLASDMQLRQISMWTMGSLVSSNWVLIPITAGFIIPGIMVFMLMARKLDIYALGEYECKDLGINPQFVKNVCIFTVALAIGASIALAGPIGFIGLVIPHIIRLTW